MFLKTLFPCLGRPDEHDGTYDHLPDNRRQRRQDDLARKRRSDLETVWWIAHSAEPRPPFWPAGLPMQTTWSPQQVQPRSERSDPASRLVNDQSQTYYETLRSEHDRALAGRTFKCIPEKLTSPELVADYYTKHRLRKLHFHQVRFFAESPRVSERTNEDALYLLKRYNLKRHRMGSEGLSSRRTVYLPHNGPICERLTLHPVQGRASAVHDSGAVRTRFYPESPYRDDTTTTTTTTTTPPPHIQHAAEPEQSPSNDMDIDQPRPQPKQRRGIGCGLLKAICGSGSDSYEEELYFPRQRSHHGTRRAQIRYRRCTAKSSDDESVI